MIHRVFPLTILVLALQATSQAAPICVAATYNTYTAAGFECEIDGAIFNNFSFPPTSASGDLAASDILVTPLSGPNAVGLRFTAPFSATGAANGAGPAEGLVSEQYRFFFDVTLGGGVFTNATASIAGGSLFSPNPAKFGGYFVGLVVDNDGAGAFPNASTPGQSETVALNTARSFISIDTLAQVTGGASASSVAPFGVAEFDSFDNIFTYSLNPVPEPATAGLIGAALIALGLLRKARCPSDVSDKICPAANSGSSLDC